MGSWFSSSPPTDEGTMRYLCKSLKGWIGDNIKVAACKNQNGHFDLIVVSSVPEQVKYVIENECKKCNQEFTLRNVTGEGYHVMHSDAFISCFQSDQTFEDMITVSDIISRRTNGLFSDMHNVNSVFYSPVRSVGYMENRHILVKEPCIVVYVDVKFDKGRVPLDCLRIPKWIKNYRTDVREGMAECLTRLPPTDYHNPVTVGCQISTSHAIRQAGTMGPIIDMGYGRVGFLTSLHVVLTKNEYHALFNGSLRINERSVYQPTDDGNPLGIKKVGNTEFLKCRNGCDALKEPGFEVAVIELQNRSPTDGGFPLDEFAFTNYNEVHPMEYTCGEYIEVTRANWRTLVEKFGATTKHTTGRYIGPISTKITMFEDNTCSFGFACQIGILGTDLRMGSQGTAVACNFAERGDSGSLVLMEENGQLKAVGIVTGMCSDGTCYVTPIKPICDELHQKGWSLMRF